MIASTSEKRACCKATASAANALCVRVVSVRIEKLLAVDLVSGDDPLPFRRNQKVDELLAEVFLDARAFRRVHQHDAVLIKEALVAFDSDDKVTAILKREPSATIGQHVGV